MAGLMDQYAAIAEWDVSTRQTNEGFIRRTIKPALGHLEVRKVRGPILDKLYTRRAAFWTHWITAKSIHFLCRPGGLSAWDHPAWMTRDIRQAGSVRGSGMPSGHVGEVSAMPVELVNGVELYWEQRGSGPRLLFCNGSGLTLQDVRPLLDPLTASFDLLAWDYRGFSRSAPVMRPYTMADVAADAAGLLEIAGWESCRVIGVSFGGMVAQEFAVTNPGRVERLALACTSAGGEGGSSYPLQKLLELPREQRVAAELKLADSRWDQRWLEAHPADRAIAERLTAAGQDQQDPAAVAARAAQLQAREGHDVWDRLGAITCPALVGYGNYDGIAPVRNSTSIASRIRGAELRGYEGGHGFLFQDPAAFPAFIAFLQAPSS